MSIGKKILKISEYGKYFAPILDSCSVDTRVIVQKERDNCHLFEKNENDHHHFTTSIIRKAGDIFLETYLENRMIGEEIKAIYKTHIHLLKALSKMLDARDPIIHYDLKSMNILVDKNEVPIIIDFGMSFTKSELLSALVDTRKLYNFFWSYNETSLPGESVDVNWPIEVELLCYIYVNKWLTEVITSSDMEDLKEAVDSYIKKDSFYDDIDTKDFQNETKQFLSQYESREWEILMEDLIDSWSTWDNYQIALTYYKYLQNKSSREIAENSFITKYVDLIGRIVFATPAKKRPGPKETMRKLTELWRSDSDMNI
jgi:hypothetical protein